MTSELTTDITRSKSLTSLFGRRDPVLEKLLRTSLLEQRMPTIQVDDATGKMLQLLTMIMRPSRVIEIGTLFGYSTIYIARGLNNSGKITTLELCPDYAAAAQRNVDLVGLQEQVDIVVGDAKEYLRGVPPGSIDMIFIDGGKADYPEYLKLAYPLLRSGGILIADDAHGEGDYSSESSQNSASQGIMKYLVEVSKDPSLFSTMIPTKHGLLVSRKEEV